MVPRMIRDIHRPQISLLILDLDNTLFDWVGAWFAMYDPLLDDLARLTGRLRSGLERELKACHEREGTSEYRDALHVLPSVRAALRADPALGAELDRIWDAAVIRQRDATACYPTVLDTLRRIVATGCRVVICSESRARELEWRLEHLGLAPTTHAVCCAPGDEEFWRSRGLRAIATPAVKPDPELVRSILSAYGISTDHTATVGDNPYKDGLMGVAAGIHVVWARYGAERVAQQGALLARLCHWSESGIDRRRFGEPPAMAFRLDARFAELARLFAFGPPQSARADQWSAGEDWSGGR